MSLLVCDIVSAPGRTAEYCNARVCLYARISQKPQIQNSPNLMHVLSVAIARSTYSGSACISGSMVCGQAKATQVGRLFKAAHQRQHGFETVAYTPTDSP